jgi:hypothetical protein
MNISARLPQPIAKPRSDLATSLWQVCNRGRQPPNGRDPCCATGYGAKPRGRDAPQSHAGRRQPPRQAGPTQRAKRRRAGVALRGKKRGKKQAIHAKPPGPRRAALPAMSGHDQYKVARSRLARQQKGQQTRACSPIRQMEPRPQGQRRPAIARHQQVQPSLPGKPGDRPQQPRRQRSRHHPGATGQRSHGRAGVRQAQGVAE